MGGASKKVTEVELIAYRQMDCATALPLLTEYLKADRDFTPLKNSHTNRWHVVAGGQEFEILTTGPKWFDTRASVGGGGAVDLAMHLLQLDFKCAVRKLRSIINQENQS
jgi:hypothetical protein